MFWYFCGYILKIIIGHELNEWRHSHRFSRTKKHTNTHTERRDEKRVVTYKFMISIFSVIITTAQHISFCVDVERVCDSFGCRCRLAVFLRFVIISDNFFFYILFLFRWRSIRLDFFSYASSFYVEAYSCTISRRWQSESNIHGSRNYKYIPGFLLRMSGVRQHLHAPQ